VMFYPTTPFFERNAFSIMSQKCADAQKVLAELIGTSGLIPRWLRQRRAGLPPFPMTTAAANPLGPRFLGVSIAFGPHPVKRWFNASAIFPAATSIPREASASGRRQVFQAPGCCLHRRPGAAAPCVAGGVNQAGRQWAPRF